MTLKTAHFSISSNSSRFRWRDKKAAARFLTSRASRFDKPVTSGGMKSFVEMGPEGGARVFFTACGGGEGETERLREWAGATCWGWRGRIVGGGRSWRGGEGSKDGGSIWASGMQCCCSWTWGILRP